MTAKVFVAVATYDADLTLFARQVESLRSQTLRDWVGAVVDDGSPPAKREAIAAIVAKEPRLRFVSYTARLGFYRNFERVLARAPRDVPYVALCDQDDRWAPHKLAAQVAVLEAQPRAQLCYSDLRLVDVDGRERAPTFWHGRPHRDGFRAVLYNNVVTGATALLRRRLLDVALPFPPDGGGAFHDHWLALCALATGELAYLDEALVDYTQHAGNALGAQALHDSGEGAAAALVARTVREAVQAPRQLARCLDGLAAHADRASRRLGSFAVALRERVAPLPPEVQEALAPFSPAPTLATAARLVRQALRAGPDETNLEAWKIPAGILWSRLQGR